jgi:predicted O-linked N-acetylglucosamine transferase (SPINDLY family)
MTSNLNIELAKNYFLMGLDCFIKRNFKSAKDYFIRSNEIAPNRINTLNNLVASLIKLYEFDEARKFSNYILDRNLQNHVTYLNIGNIFESLFERNKAIEYYNKAISISPTYADAYLNKGAVLEELNLLSDALDCYSKAYMLNPEIDYLEGNIQSMKMYLCDWSDFDKYINNLLDHIKIGKKCCPCFPLLAMTDSLEAHFKCAQIWGNDEHPSKDKDFNFKYNAANKKIRLAYYSADFHNHATAYLMAELFELHDRNNFYVIGFSYGPNKNDAMRNRLRENFDEFIDVFDKSDEYIISLSRKLAIDIGIDLKGYTSHSRTDIFANRVAPIQVSWIGYPGTMAVDYIDYIIADKKLIPIESQKFYSEKIIYLPDSYQVNDRQRRISEKIFTREELGLPEDAFVYCCFNNNYKISPTIYSSWMYILKNVKNSVLWLLEDNHIAANNLKKEASSRGVDPSRIIFAKRVDYANHLSRQKVADLFLDTTPYNAHTTTSDALWIGLPVLTCCGTSFASRVASSLLAAVGLEELVVNSLVEYELKAIELANNKIKLLEYKTMLSLDKESLDLFNTPKFVINLEKAYFLAHDNMIKNRKPEHIVIE